jgi:hypothetical protein
VGHDSSFSSGNVLTLKYVLIEHENFELQHGYKFTVRLL